MEYPFEDEMVKLGWEPRHTGGGFKGWGYETKALTAYLTRCTDEDMPQSKSEMCDVTFWINEDFLNEKISINEASLWIQCKFEDILSGKIKFDKFDFNY